MTDSGWFPDKAPNAPQISKDIRRGNAHLDKQCQVCGTSPCNCCKRCKNLKTGCTCKVSDQFLQGTIGEARFCPTIFSILREKKGIDWIHDNLEEFDKFCKNDANKQVLIDLYRDDNLEELDVLLQGWTFVKKPDVLLKQDQDWTFVDLQFKQKKVKKQKSVKKSKKIVKSIKVKSRTPKKTRSKKLTRRTPKKSH